jgi:hypothetical protein
VPSKIEAPWPVTVLTKQGAIKGKSRAIINKGLFVYGDKRLPQMEMPHLLCLKDKICPELIIPISLAFPFKSLLRVFFVIQMYDSFLIPRMLSSHGAKQTVS